MNFAEEIERSIKVDKINENEYTVKHKATFLDGSPILVKIIAEGGSFMFSDDQSTLKYMNDHYELRAKDVKMCIANVIKLHGFSIQSGKILGKIADTSKIAETFFRFIMCISELANMHVFFDNPN